MTERGKGAVKRALVFVGVGAVAVVIGVVALMYWADRQVQLGLDADANGTVGDITTADYIQGGLILALVVGGAVFTLWALLRWLRARQSGAAPSTHSPES